MTTMMPVGTTQVQGTALLAHCQQHDRMEKVGEIHNGTFQVAVRMHGEKQFIAVALDRQPKA